MAEKKSFTGVDFHALAAAGLAEDGGGSGGGSKRTVGADRLERIAREHIERYEVRVARARGGHTMFNERECISYLKLWQSILAKIRRLNKRMDFTLRDQELGLTAAERYEIIDALADEDNG